MVILRARPVLHFGPNIKKVCAIIAVYHLPEGLRKNQKLEQPVLTPTTKEKEHDRPITPKEIIAEGWMTQQIGMK